MKKAVVLGAISPFCDIVREADGLGVEPIVCDYYSDAPAKKMGFLSYDISTMDVPELLKLSKREKVDGIISAYSDRNLMPTIELCKTLGLPYFFDEKIISIVTDKTKMKACFSRFGLPIIKYKCTQIENAFREASDMDFPVVVKPADAYGSKGITVCDNPEEIEEACKNAVKASLVHVNDVVIEEYYRADELSITAWVKDGRSYITCIYDVFRNVDRGFTLAAVSFPSKYTISEFENIKRLLDYVVKCFGIKDGPITLQCFIGKKGIKVSELLCRLAGGSPYLYSIYLGGPNIAKMMIQKNVGEEIDYQNLEEFRPIKEIETVYYDVSVQVRHKGRIEYLIDIDSIKKKVPEIIDCRIYYMSGEELVNVGSNGVTFAKIIFKTARDVPYDEVVSKVESNVRVNDTKGNKVSFVSIPQNIDVKDKYDVDWSFLRGF